VAAAEDDVLAKVETGKSDDPDKFTDSESLGKRHRHFVGYDDEGAAEHDHNLVLKGHAPLRVNGPHRQQNVGGSRNGAFSQGVVGGIVKHS
jgi:hypothetical protein